MKSSLNATFALLLIIADFLAVLGAFALAYVFRVTLSGAPFIGIPASDYAQMFILLSPVWLGIFAMFGLYNRDVYEWRLKEIGRILVGSVVGIMAMITYEFTVNKPIFPARIVPVYAFIMACLLLILGRTLLRVLRLFARHRGFGIIRTLIIGDSPYTLELLEDLKKPRRSGFHVVGLVTSQDLPKWYRGKVFDDVDLALEAIEQLAVHSVVLTKPYADAHINEKIMARAHEAHCAFRFVPDQDALYSSIMEVELFQGKPLILVHRTPLNGMRRIAKRLFDIVVSLLGLIITSPIMLLAALAIALFDNGGPITFKQPRLSRFNSTIGVFKFRTHKAEYSGMLAEEAFAKMGKPHLAEQYRKNSNFLANDPRVSTIGKFLRATSIDELPQLFNVLRGDISLVGPRALVSRELEDYPYTSLLLSVKSGITGLAQISGRENISFDERRRLDLYYVQNWSFWLDIKILARTILEVLTRRGAA